MLKTKKRGYYIKSPLSGIIRKSKDYIFSERIIRAKNSSKKGKWVVIAMLLHYWAKENPEVFKAYKSYLVKTKQGLFDKKFGETKDKNMDRRIILSMPAELQQMIRTVYPVDELPFDKKFFKEFARRFRMFQIPDRI